MAMMTPFYRNVPDSKQSPSTYRFSSVGPPQALPPVASPETASPVAAAARAPVWPMRMLPAMPVYDTGYVSQVQQVSPMPVYETGYVPQMPVVYQQQGLGAPFDASNLATKPKKRKRKKFNEVERLYKCNFPNCSKAYGTLNHLNCHITLQKHGKKRLPSEFKELREKLKLRRKLERDRQRKKQERDDADKLAQSQLPSLPPIQPPAYQLAPAAGNQYMAYRQYYPLGERTLPGLSQAVPKLQMPPKAGIAKAFEAHSWKLPNLLFSRSSMGLLQPLPHTRFTHSE